MSSTMSIQSPDAEVVDKIGGYPFTETPKGRFKSQPEAPSDNQGFAYAKPYIPRDILATDFSDVFNSAGLKMYIHPLWHVELSPTKHAYLQRNGGGDLELHIKTFKINNEKKCMYTESGVKLDMQQTRDMMFCLLQVRGTVLRNEDYQVRT